MFQYTDINTNDLVILYIEDDEKIVQCLEEILNKLCKKVIVGSNGKVGLELFKEYKDEIDVIVTDIMMPEMDGLQMYVEICKIKPNTPVVVTTAHSDSNYLMKAIELGVSKYIVKPIQIKDLINKIKEAYCPIFQQTILKNINNELKNKNQELEKAQSISKLGSWTLDFNSDKLTWSDEIYNIFEIDRDNFKCSYESFLELIHPDDKEIVNEAYNKSLKNKKPYNIVHRVLLKNNKIKWVEERCNTEFNEDDNPLVSRGTVQDITQEYELREQLKEKERQLFEQAKLSHMGEMIENIAHQWRQPLSAVMTASSGLSIESEVGTINKEKIKFYTTNINKNAKFLSSTINTFSDFIQEEKELKNVVIQDRIETVIDIIGISLKNNHIDFKYNNEADKLNTNMVVGELDQVIINILNNAKDVLLKENVENPLIELNLIKEDNKAIITIEDNGGGISNDILPKIFDPYFTTKHKSQGTGLGLNMSYKIVTESLKGKLYAKNTKNGAKFFIEIPL